MSSLNRVILIGRVGADPDIRTMQDGRLVASFSLATSQKWIDASTSEKKERTHWHRVVVLSSGLCRVVKDYIKKGALISLEGCLQNRKYTDNTGNERYITEIVLLPYDSKLMLLVAGSGGSDGSGGSGGSGGGSDQCYLDSLVDQIPF